MTTGVLRFAAWALLASGVGGVGWAALAPLPRTETHVARTVVAAVAALPPPLSADSLRRVMVVGDLFRLDRRPASVAFDPLQPAVSGVVIAPPKPALRLVGLVWGGQPQALVDGLPGAEGGRVVRQGDVVAGLRVVEVHQGRVRIVGLDTAWVLTLRRP